MKTLNVLIVVLLGIGVFGLALVEGYIKPEISRQEQQYLLAQKDPLTHDFSRVLRFRNRNVGNMSNVANLNASLPLSDIQRTFQLYPEALTLEINYEEAAAGIEAELFRRSLVYNATANFVLIDNLVILILNFKDVSFTISRSAVERWYDVELTSLQSEEQWEDSVQRRLADRAYVDSFIEDNLITGP
jgi:hypothetical protein